MGLFGRLRGGYAGKRALLAFAVLAAFLFQSFLTATHVHDPASFANTIAASHGTAAKLPAHRGAPADPANNCPVCHAVANSGHFLAPAPIVFLAAMAAVLWLFAAAFQASTFTRRSHAWRSRAPPR